MKALVVGAEGLVGQHLVGSLAKRGHQVEGTTFSDPLEGYYQIDIRDAESTSSLFHSVRPDVVFHAAAIANVEYCEENPAAAYETNVKGTAKIVWEANQCNAKVVFFSTDYVFDGKSGPYREEDVTNPISVYGRQKLCAEHYISLFSKSFLIIRTTVVFGMEEKGKNFIQRLIRTLEKHEQIHVPFDQIGSPTYVNCLAEAVVELVEKRNCGLFNITGSDQISRYDFAVRAAREFDLDTNLIKSISTPALKQKASRPLLAGLINRKAQTLLETKLLGIEESLHLLKEEWNG